MFWCAQINCFLLWDDDDNDDDGIWALMLLMMMVSWNWIECSPQILTYFVAVAADDDDYDDYDDNYDDDYDDVDDD